MPKRSNQVEVSPSVYLDESKKYHWILDVEDNDGYNDRTIKYEGTVAQMRKYASEFFENDVTVKVRIYIAVAEYSRSKVPEVKGLF